MNKNEISQQGCMEFKHSHLPSWLVMPPKHESGRTEPMHTLAYLDLHTIVTMPHKDTSTKDQPINGERCKLTTLYCPSHQTVYQSVSSHSIARDLNIHPTFLIPPSNISANTQVSNGRGCNSLPTLSIPPNDESVSTPASDFERSWAH
jgi:hypothetical protein